ncbi:MAG: hypothetical protein PVF83_10115 [Anaerolineales bacterium]|jgi:hypothetical protein
MKNVFTIIPQFLQDPHKFYSSIQRNQELKVKAAALFISSVIIFAIYGLMTGLSHSWQQALSTAVKMPVLFLITLAITLPALYFFSLALLNVQFSVAQAGVVVLSGIGISAFLLLGLSPITLFFVLTSSNYTFFKLLALVFVAVSGIIGLSYILKGFAWVDKKNELTSKPIGVILLRVWVVLFGFVGAQMTWRLSPFIGAPQTPFAIIHPARDNFFVDVLKTIEQVLGINSKNSTNDYFIYLFCGGILVLFALAVGMWLVPKSKRSSLKTSSQPAQPQHTHSQSIENIQETDDISKHSSA